MGFEGTRINYDAETLEEATAGSDPVVLLRKWLDQAVTAQVVEPTAMVIATTGLEGQPRSRTVLLRHLLDEGPVFFTSYDSDKGWELAAEPRCAAQLGWLDLQRQVRIEGHAKRVTDSQSDEYFAGRPRGSQIGAWASPQSRVIQDREELASLVAATEKRFAGDPVPRPPDWGGYLIVAESIEFWQGRRSRLHDRLRYRRVAAEADTTSPHWVRERLAP